MKKIKSTADQLIPLDIKRNDTSNCVIHMIDNPDLVCSRSLENLNLPIVVAPFKQTSKHIILDGNQRAIGFALRKRSIDSIIISDQKDLNELLFLKSGIDIAEWPYGNQFFKGIYDGALEGHEARFKYVRNNKIYTLKDYVKILK